MLTFTEASNNFIQNQTFRDPSISENEQVDLSMSMETKSHCRTKIYSIKISKIGAPILYKATNNSVIISEIFEENTSYPKTNFESNGP